MFEIHIKNMVCPRCIETVRAALIKLHLSYTAVRLGVASLSKPLDKDQKSELEMELQKHGFQLLEEKNQQLVNAIKSLVIDLIYREQLDSGNPFSEIIGKKMLKDYSHLSRVFSTTEGKTIEKFIIEQKIERAKELLTYEELTVSEIAHRLGYSSVAHLSGQFRQITGMPPSRFKDLAENQRKSIDEI